MATETQKYMGKGQLIKRLAAQIAHSGFKGDATAAAINQLKKRGHVDSKGYLTAAGRARDRMTAEERAIDRAAKRTKRSERSEKDFKYSSSTNNATVKRK